MLPSTPGCCFVLINQCHACVVWNAGAGYPRETLEAIAKVVAKHPRLLVLLTRMPNVHGAFC